MAKKINNAQSQLQNTCSVSKNQVINGAIQSLKRHRNLAVMAAVGGAISAIAGHANATNILWSSSGGSAWLSGANWTGNAVPGSGDVAQFGANPTAATGAGINFGSATNAGTQTNGNRIEDVGAIEVTSARAAAMIIGNSSGTAANTGTLRVLGATVNGVSNVIVRNNSNQNLTIQNIQASGASTMAFSLANATENKIVLDGSGNIIISDVIKSDSGTTPLTLMGGGSGRVDITGTANTFTGTINVLGAEVRFTDTGSLGDANNTVVIDGGRFGIVSGGTVTIAATHAIQVGNAANTAISTPGAGTLTYNGIIANKTGITDGGFAKQGGGTLALGGVSTYGGATAINNGTLQLSTGNDRLPTGTVVSLGQNASTNLGILDLNGRNQQIAGLNSTSGTNASASNNAVTSTGAATLTIGGAGTYSYGDGSNANSGVIAGAISVVVSGGGAQTFGDVNTYSGGTSVTAGTLTASNSSALGTGNISVLGGTLSTSVSNLGVSSGKASLGSGGLALNGSSIGTLTLGSSKNFDMTGGTWTVSLGSSNASDKIIGSGVSTFTISAGTIALDGTIGVGTYTLYSGFSTVSTSSVSITGYDPGTLNANFANGVLTLTAAAGADLYYTADGSTLGGSGAWTQTGGTNWSPSDTTVVGAAFDGTKTANFTTNPGTVTVDGAGVSANKGIRFTVGGYTLTGGTVTLGGATQLLNTITANTGTTTFDSNLTAGNGFTKSGGGTLAVTGSVSAAGGVNLTGGTLQVGTGGTAGSLSGDVAIGTSTNLTFNRSDAVNYSGNLSGSGTVSSTGGDLGLAGNIIGSVGINNTGSRTVTLSGSTVSTSGAINFSGGTLAFGDAGIGTSAVSLSNGGTLSFVGSTTPKTISNSVSVGTGGGTVSVQTNNSLTLSTAITTGGALTKDGGGNLTVTPAFSTGGNTLTVANGNFILGQTSGAVATIDAATTLTGNLVVLNAARVNVNAGGSITGAGQLRYAATGGILSNVTGNAGGTIAAPIALNSNNTAFTLGSWSGTTYTADSFITYIGGTKGVDTSTVGGLTLSGAISGNAGVDISNSATGGGGGVLVLNAASTYTGNTAINGNTPEVAGTANIKLGIANALPTTTGIIVGTTAGIGAAVLDMNGFNQQVAYLADGSNVTAAKFLTIKNNGTADSVLTMSGDTTPGTSTFGGVIADGTTNKISIVKDGSYSQSFSGANTFTGGVTINNGEIKLRSAGALNAAGTNALALAGNGTLTTNGNSVTVSDLSGSTNTVIQNNLASTSSILTVNKASGASTFAGTIANGAALNATQGLKKIGSGEIALSGANSYTGPTTVNGGTLRVSNNTALGTSAVTVNDGSLYGAAGVTSNNSITVAGIAGTPVLLAGWDFQSTGSGGTATAASPNTPTSYTANIGTGTLYLNGTSGSSSWSQSTELNALAGTSVNTAGTSFSTTTSGAAALALLGGTGTSANNKSIVFLVNMAGKSGLSVSYATQGTTTGFATQNWSYSTDGSNWTAADSFTSIPTSYAAQALSTDLSPLNGISTAYLRLTVTGASGASGNNRLDNFQFITPGTPIFGSPVLGSDITSGTTEFAGTVTLNAAASFNSAAGGTAVFSGSIGGTGAVTKTGDGIVKFTNASNAYTSATNVNAGKLIVDGVLNIGGGTVAVNSGGTLGGAGTIHRLVDVKADGTLAPGSSTAILTVDTVNLEANSNLSIELNGTTVGTGHDQLLVNGGTDGNVSLNGSNLVLSLTFDAQIGNTFTIIDNDSSDAVIGTFAQGNLITTNFGGLSYDFGISYTGGTGNDVVLTTLTPEPTSLGLIGLATTGLLARRRRNRKA